MNDRLTILCGDALEKLRELPDESAQCCVTSPPFWGLRDYGTATWDGGEDGCDHKAPSRFDYPLNAGLGPTGIQKQDSNVGSGQSTFRDNCGKCGAKRIDAQLGLEKTPEEYVAKMVEVFREVRRVLRKDGTLWLNLGDSYAGSLKGANGDGTWQDRSDCKQGTNAGSLGIPPQRAKDIGLKNKDLVGIPWMVAFALRADGWWLRSDIIWAKPNPMPESVTDRPTKSHEYIFLLTKSAKYFYDAEAIKEPSTDLIGSTARYEHQFRRLMVPEMPEGNKYSIAVEGTRQFTGDRNKRSVWTVTTQPYPEAHFATYPPDLIKPCIMAGTSAKGCCSKCGAPWERVLEREPNPNGITGGEHREIDRDGGLGMRDRDPEREARIGQSKTINWKCQCGFLTDMTPREIIPCTVLDPFAGSGTTGLVSLELGRKAILIELNPKYITLIEQRTDVTPGLALA